jgi:phosphatidylserine/phosphatidylglycerophosphate/cardiolipin synthase-like enzyme
VVCDDTVATGSFNLSSNATKNAEYSLMIHDPRIADQYLKYIDAVIAAY